MNVNDIVESRRVRRKLTFWRIAAFVLVATAIVLLWTVLSDGDLTGRTEKDHIAHVVISGVIQDDTELLKRLDAIANKPSAKALIISISSPGGTTYGGEVIYKAIRKVAEKKPVVSDVRTLAASAGYMVAIAGDHIVAGDTSITGSIGVIFQYPQIKTLLDKIGVSMEEIKSAPLKAEPSPFHEASEASKDVMRLTVMDTFDWFVDLVAARRNLPRPEALKLADGRVYTGRQALKFKLVDEIGGDEQIRNFLQTQDVDRSLPVVEWLPPARKSPFFLAGMARQFLRWSGLDWLNGLDSLGNVSEDKMLLDGLVSVWQFEQK